MNEQGVGGDVRMFGPPGGSEVQFQANCFRDVDDYVLERGGFKVSLAGEESIFPRRQERKAEPAIVIRGNRLCLVAALADDLNGDAREYGPGRVEGDAGDCS